MVTHVARKFSHGLVNQVLLLTSIRRGTIGQRVRLLSLWLGISRLRVRASPRAILFWSSCDLLGGCWQFLYEREEFRKSEDMHSHFCSSRVAVVWAGVTEDSGCA